MEQTQPSDLVAMVAINEQRRQMTVLFCDLVGSTAMSQRLDPEDMQEIVLSFFNHWTAVIEASDGFIARYMGDGIMAYFGYPSVREDDVERAVRAAYEIACSAPELSIQTDEKLSVRIGIATGVVVMGNRIGKGFSAEHLVVGDTPNIAARLQSIAAINQIVVNDTVRQLAAKNFNFRRLPQVALKGLQSDLAIFELLGPVESHSSTTDRKEQYLAPLIGRDDELALVLERWNLSKTVAQQLVGIVGEAGIGKSHFLDAAIDAIEDQAKHLLFARGEPTFSNTPFYAFRGLILRSLETTNGTEFDQLGMVLRKVDIKSKSAVSLVAGLLGISTPTSYAPITESPEIRRSNAIALLIDWLKRLSRQKPVLLVLEDLHWIDPSTTELVQELMNACSDLPLMVLYAGRDRADHSWSSGVVHTQITLPRLAKTSIKKLLHSSTNGFDFDTTQMILERAQGIPLFAIELARHFSAHDQKNSDTDIPATLSDLLMARLSRAGPAMKIAQYAAIFGNEANEKDVAALAGIDHAPLEGYFETLTECGIMVEIQGQTGRVFRFSHALVRDAAYDALLKRQKIQLHRRVALLLENSTGEQTGIRPEILAHHWAMAQEPENALSAWRNAVRETTNQCAYKEAQKALEEAISVLVTFPHSAERDADELLLQSKLGATLQITTGYSSSVAAAATARAQMLAQMTGDAENQFANYAGAWMAASSAGNYQAATDLAERLVPLAQAIGTNTMLGAAHMIEMTTSYRTGNLEGAEHAFQRGTSYFSTPDFAANPGGMAQTFGNAALIAWIRGQLPDAKRRLKRLVTLSKSANNPYDMTFAAAMAATIMHATGDFGGALSTADQALDLALERGYPQFAATARIVAGSAKAQLGSANAGIALMRQGLDAMHQTRSRAGISMYLVWLAQALASVHDFDDAIKEVENAITINPQERFYAPEAMRVRAHLDLQSDQRDTAKNRLNEAMALAKAMGAQHFHRKILCDIVSLK